MENRLIKMQTTSSAIFGGVPNYTLEFTYDAYGRRVRKKFLIGTSTSSDEKFVCDGWNAIGKFYGSTDTKHQSYLWSLDLSEAAQGAGGVGGLLAVRDYSPSFQGDHYVGYDGNGNVNLLVKASGTGQGTITAEYAYDAFGQQMRWKGSFVNQNPFRFSTKYTDTESGMLYYGYRYYDPTRGRWLSRDPIGERGPE